jgi:hypothetical protein
MRLFGLIAALALLALCLPGIVAVADGPQAQSTLPVPITSDPGQYLAPAIAVGDDGLVLIAWQRQITTTNTVQIELAQSPDWHESRLASLSPLPVLPLQFSLLATPQVRLAWPQPLTFTQAFVQATPGSRPITSSWELPLFSLSTFAVDGHGRTHVVWGERDKLNYRVSTESITVTQAISPGLVLREIALSLDGGERPHVAWAAVDSLDGAPAGITYTSFISGTEPLLVSREGYGPQLEMGPRYAHLCWLTNKGLYCADSRDWANASLVVPNTAGLPAPVRIPFALAVGPRDVTHLVWFQDQVLWYANSADWQCSQRKLASATSILGLDITVDEHGAPYITWAASYEELQPSTNIISGSTPSTAVFYLGPSQPDLQLGSIFPQGGEMLAANTAAEIVANLPARDILRVEFYLQSEDLLPLHSTQAPAGDDVYLRLGFDRHGRDLPADSAGRASGSRWSVPLVVTDLQNTKRYRLVALGIDNHGTMTRTEGNWFTAQSTLAPWVWVQAPAEDPASAETSVSALLGTSNAAVDRLDLYLVPVVSLQDDDVVANPVRLPGPDLPPLYVGSYAPLTGAGAVVALQGAATAWQKLDFDSRRFPDGSYRVLVAVRDHKGYVGYGFSAQVVHLANARRPVIEITAPQQGTVVTDTLRVEVRADDPAGVIQRVDFYIERGPGVGPSLAVSGCSAPQAAERLWLGSDTDGSDGWSMSSLVSEALDGDAWQVYAVAYDQEGLSGSARSGALAVMGYHRPVMRIVAPRPQSTLHGVEMVSVFITSGVQYLQQADIYLEAPDCALTYLGRMTPAYQYLNFTWDIAADLARGVLGNGPYALLIVAHHVDGRQSLLRTGGLTLRALRPEYDFAQPAANETLVGLAGLRVQSSAPVPLTATQILTANPFMLRVRFYSQDQSGELHDLGPGLWDGDGWCAIWNTTTVPDGTYTVVALLVDTASQPYRLDRQVVVRNYSPRIVWDQ